MSSIAKKNFLGALTERMTTDRPADLPLKVTRNDKKEVELHIIPEHNLDPEKNQLPAMLFIADGGSTLHPRLINFELRLDNRFNVDDFDEETVAIWQSALAATLDNSAALIPQLNENLCTASSKWHIRKMTEGAPGDLEVGGQRSRELSDSWTVWMMKG